MEAVVCIVAGFSIMTIMSLLFCLAIYPMAVKRRWYMMILATLLFLWGCWIHYDHDKSQREPDAAANVACRTLRDSGFRDFVSNTMGAVSSTLSSFFPSRGPYPQKADATYWLFHISVIIFIANLVISFFGMGFTNWMRICGRSLLKRETNVFWGYGDECEALSGSMPGGQDSVVIAILGGAKSCFQLKDDKTISSLIARGIKWFFVDGRIPSVIAKAERHFFLSPDGHSNVAQAEAVIKAWNGPGRRTFYVRINAMADDDILFKWADRWNMDKTRDVEIVVVREESLAAHGLLLRFPMLTCPGIKVDTATATAEGEFRVLLIGYGAQGSVMLNDMICDAQFLDGSGRRIPFAADVVDRNPVSFMSFKERCPDAVQRFNIGFRCADAGDGAFWGLIKERIAVKPYNRIVVCLKDDRQNISVANDIGRYCKTAGLPFRDVIFARVRDARINQYIESTFGVDESERMFVPFGSLKTLYTFMNIVKPQWENGAVWLNGDYVNAGDAPHDEARDREFWKGLSFFNRESTRAAFFNQRNFLRLLGYRIDETDSDNACFNEDDPRNRLDVLAEDEHLRWMAYHFVRGVRVWRPTEKEIRDIAHRNGGKVRHNRIKDLNAHADLVEFCELPDVDALFGTENTQGKDRRFVRSEAMRKSNLGIRRA